MTGRWTGPMRRRANEGAERHPRFGEYQAKARLVAGQLQNQVQLGQIWSGTRSIRIAPDATVYATVVDNFGGQPLVQTRLQVTPIEVKKVPVDIEIPDFNIYNKLRFGTGTKNKYYTYADFDDVLFNTAVQTDYMFFHNVKLKKPIWVDSLYALMQDGLGDVAIFEAEEVASYADGWGSYTSLYQEGLRSKRLIPVYGWAPNPATDGGNKNYDDAGVGEANHPDIAWVVPYTETGNPYLKVGQMLAKATIQGPNLLPDDPEYPPVVGLSEPLRLEAGKRYLVGFRIHQRPGTLEEGTEIILNGLVLQQTHDSMAFYHTMEATDWAEGPAPFYDWGPSEQPTDYYWAGMCHHAAKGIWKTRVWDENYDNGFGQPDGRWVIDDWYNWIHDLQQPEDWVGAPLTFWESSGSIWKGGDVPKSKDDGDDPDLRGGASDKATSVPAFGWLGQTEDEKIREGVQHTPVYSW